MENGEQRCRFRFRFRFRFIFYFYFDFFLFFAFYFQKTPTTLRRRYDDADDVSFELQMASSPSSLFLPPDISFAYLYHRRRRRRRNLPSSFFFPAFFSLPVGIQLNYSIKLMQLSLLLLNNEKQKIQLVVKLAGYPEGCGSGSEILIRRRLPHPEGSGRMADAPDYNPALCVNRSFD